MKQDSATHLKKKSTSKFFRVNPLFSIFLYITDAVKPIYADLKLTIHRNQLQSFHEKLIINIR